MKVCENQKGMILIIALIFLSVTTLAAVSALESSFISLKMARNYLASFKPLLNHPRLPRESEDLMYLAPHLGAAIKRFQLSLE